MPDLSDLLGARYAPKGRDPRTGLDCWGLVMEVFRRHGVSLPDLGALAPDRPDLVARWIRMREGLFRPVPEITLGPRPLIVLMRLHPSHASHTGALVEGNIVYHATEAAGVIAEPFARLRRVKGCYTW